MTQDSGNDDYRGCLDVCDFTHVAGWAADGRQPGASVKVDILVNGALLRTLPASALRADLVPVLGSGNHGFDFVPTLSDHIPDDAVIDCRISGTAVSLPGAPRRLGRRKLGRSGLFHEDTLISVTGSLPAGGGGGRLALVALFRPGNRMNRNQQHLVRSLKAAGFTVVAILAVDDPSPPTDLEADVVVLRRNLGWDFASWGLGLHLFGHRLADFDGCLLVNDSIIGPLFDMAPLFDRMSAAGHDLWGLTDSWEGNYHIQSYFLYARPPAFGLLANFFHDYAYPVTKPEVIQQGELGLGRALTASGLQVGVLCPYQEVTGLWLARHDHDEASAGPEMPDDGCCSHRHRSPRRSDDFVADVLKLVRQGAPVNATHFFWDILVTEFSFPFLKKELFLKNPCRVSSLHRLEEVLTLASGFDRAILLDVLRAESCGMAPPPLLPSKAPRRDLHHV